MPRSVVAVAASEPVATVLSAVASVGAADCETGAQALNNVSTKKKRSVVNRCLVMGFSVLFKVE